MRTHEQRNHESAAARDDAIYRDEFIVPEAAIDANGHVNNVAYVQWMQDAAIRHFASIKGMDLMHDLGATWVVRSHGIEYLAEAFAGDRIEARTWVANFRRVRSLRRYEFVRVSDGVALAKGETEWVFVNAESGRPCSIPDEIKHMLPLAPEGPES